MVLMCRGDAPKKKKNPNRLIVDDAVNDDNSVRAIDFIQSLALASMSRKPRPCFVRTGRPDAHGAASIRPPRGSSRRSQSIANLPAGLTSDAVGAVALDRLERPGEGRFTAFALTESAQRLTD
jgi:hypothetical protein